MQCDELIIILSAALSGLLKLESRKVCRKKGPHTDIHNRWKLNQGKRKNKINYEGIYERLPLPSEFFFWLFGPLRPEQLLEEISLMPYPLFLPNDLSQ